MKIGVTGCKGRMGAMLVKEILSGAIPGVELAGGTVSAEALKKTKEDYFVTDDADALFKKSDAVIDFTAPEATRKHIWLAAKHHKSYILGTTGLTAVDEKELKDAAKETRIVYAANMSMGVNILLALVEKAAASLGPEWDIEIFEAHHKHKIDAPSGTALALGKFAAKGRKLKQQPKAHLDRHGARKTGEIGFASSRGGDAVGEHLVTFFGEGERVTFGHIATDRALFARGALKAALWTEGKPDGLYSMRDVLGI